LQSALVVLCALVASSVAEPKPAFLAAAPVVAAPAGVVTATSSQYVARNFNGVAAAPVVAAAYTAPVAAAYTAPVAAAYTAPVAAAYSAYPYAAYPYTAGYTTVL